MPSDITASVCLVQLDPTTGQRRFVHQHMARSLRATCHRDHGRVVLDKQQHLPATRTTIGDDGLLLKTLQRQGLAIRHAAEVTNVDVLV